MSEHDTLQRFIFEDADIRGEIVHLNQSFQTIMQQHQYSQPLRQLLGEALVAATLLSATIKFEGQLTLQFQSEGMIRMLVAKCTHDFSIRGLVKTELEDIPDDSDTYFILNGHLVVTIESNKQAKPYQSIIPIQRQTISQALEHYFATSEQLATRIWLSVTKERASGMLLQLLPGKSIKKREEFWEHAVKLGETLTEKELHHLPNTTILTRLYHQENIRIFDPSPIIFACTCNVARMKNAVRMLGKQETLEILTSNRYVTVTCEFCNKEYDFDKIDIEEIFHQENLH